ncbi:MAG: EAL domain-containing protein [Thiobacillus sp.]
MSMRPYRYLYLLAALIGVLTVAAVAVYVAQAERAYREMRAATLHEAERRAAQLASAAAIQLEALVRGVDLALQQLRRDSAGDLSDFDKSVHAVIETLGSDFIDQVSLAGADGFLIYNSGGLRGPVNISDREHFQVHAGSGADRLFIGQPVKSRITGRWIIPVTRPILRDGRFAGVVNILLFPDKISEQLARITLERDDVVVLLRDDGKYLARSRNWASLLGESVRKDRPFLQPGAPDRGAFRAPASSDGVVRLFAWQRLAERSLIAVVGLAEAPLLAPLESDAAAARRRNAVVAAVILLLGIGAALLLVRVARQQKALLANEERYRRLHESMVDAYVRTDLDGRLVEWNHAYEEMLGYTADALRGKRYLDLTPQRWHEFEARIVAEQILTRGYSEVYEKEYIRSDGTVFPVELRTFLLRGDDGAPIGMWAIVRDITERKLVEARIQHLAHHDTLTGLPNRAALARHLAQAIAAAHREQSGLAVMLIDLDRFKSVNDNLGHLVGDRMLIEVGQRLRAAVRESDIVARLGGDEFIVVLVGVSDAATIEAVARKLQTALSQPYHADGYDLHTTPSIGISRYPADGDDAEALIRHADAAMYQAKAQGRDNWQFYSESLSVAAAERLRIETGLRGALQRNEFVLHYQPQLELGSDRIVAVEALVRWQHPELGLVSPDRFIPIAEDMGLIVPLGDWVLDEACAQLRRWHDVGLSGLRMCVNLSARQLQKPGLHELVAATLARHGLNAADLELEITESMAMADPAETITVLEKLKALGVTLAIDDFGTGYSSLSYLKLLPIQRLKLDRSFVGDIETDPDDASICRATASLAHDLGLSLVAEGVETEAQYRFLKDIGCNLLQGYWLARPLPADTAGEMVLKHNTGITT